jgi:hypothetical protein
MWPHNDGPHLSRQEEPLFGLADIAGRRRTDEVIPRCQSFQAAFPPTSILNLTIYTLTLTLTLLLNSQSRLPQAPRPHHDPCSLSAYRVPKKTTFEGTHNRTLLKALEVACPSHTGKADFIWGKEVESPNTRDRHYESELGCQIQHSSRISNPAWLPDPSPIPP